jgi:peptide chain release factor 3
MALEKERGISVTSSVMQFPYEGRIVNLLDTPGHADFGEDTYRVLTAVDSALMVIDCAKGVEERTIKLMDVCRLRDTPIMTFINKLDREGRSPIDLLDEIEAVLRHPVRAGHLADRHGPRLKGVYHLLTGEVHLYEPGAISRARTRPSSRPGRAGAGSAHGAAMLARTARRTRTGAGRIASVRSRGLSVRQADAGVLRLGRQQLRRAAAAGFLRRARAVAAAARHQTRTVDPRKKLTGFVFKIQANMDPQHRDRVAFMRICSGASRPA